jgi:hypothetical protein
MVRRHIPESNILHSHRCENQKSTYFAYIPSTRFGEVRSASVSSLKNVTYFVEFSVWTPGSRASRSSFQNVSELSENCQSLSGVKPVTVAERPKACTVFARSEAGIVGSNLTQGMDVWCAFFCVCVQVEAASLRVPSFLSRLLITVLMHVIPFIRNIIAMFRIVICFSRCPDELVSFVSMLYLVFPLMCISQAHSQSEYDISTLIS